MGGLIYLVGIIAAVWVIYEVWTQNTRLSDTEKLIWTIGAIFFSVITAVIYYFTQKRRSY
ncbi:MAG: PLDc N-terminal domain-containing protein [Cytophagales bacterium]|nr:PLDc N-terminal domain-containing protein [Cytophagales bacterium]